MPRRLDYTDEAINDLQGIRRWLTQPGSGPAARLRLKAIRAAINRLRNHPSRYPIGRLSGVRELPCAGGDRALYQVSSDTGGDIMVLRVFGPGRSRETL